LKQVDFNTEAGENIGNNQYKVKLPWVIEDVSIGDMVVVCTSHLESLSIMLTPFPWQA